MNILVPFDGSQTSNKALNKAIKIAKENDATIHLLSVVEKQGFTLPSVVDFQEQKEKFTTALHNKEVELQKLDIDCKTILKTDSEPNKSIINYSNQHNMDLIVIGRRGLNRVKRILVGSTSSYVIEHAKIDVFVIAEAEH